MKIELFITKLYLQDFHVYQINDENIEECTSTMIYPIKILFSLYKNLSKNLNH